MTKFIYTSLPRQCRVEKSRGCKANKKVSAGTLFKKCISNIVVFFCKYNTNSSQAWYQYNKGKKHMKNVQIAEKTL
jgi:hypothetical protein